MADTNEMTLSLFESRFKNRKYIGSGGFAKVYKAFDHAKNHYVALKVADVRPEWKQFTLQREVELVNKLPPHPNVARYDACYRFDMGVAGEIDFAILKFYEDGNLEQFISDHELTAEDVRIIIKGILRGVSFLHNNNYVHRDMKCQNILIQRDDGVWTPKITDFGLSRSLGNDSTANNSAIGLSYAYSSPEQIQNRRIYKNVDIWAVGVIIYRVIAGELPFRSGKTSDNRDTQSQLELSRKIVNVELPEKLDTLEEPYQAIIRRCLIADPKVRCQSAEELLSLLDGEKPFVGNFEEDEPDAHPTFFVPVEPERPLEDDKTRLITPPVEPAAVAPSPPVIAPVAPPPPVAAPPPVFTPQPEYITPKADYTQIIENKKKEAPAAPPPPVESHSPVLGEPEKGTKWWWFVIPLLLLGGGFAAYKMYFDKKISPRPISGSFVKVLTYEELRQENEAAKGDPEKLEQARTHIEESIKTYPKDYLRVYELAKNQVYSSKPDDAFKSLKIAAMVAIDNGNSLNLIADLNKDKQTVFWDLYNSSSSKWEQLLKGIKNKDKGLIEIL